MYEGLSLIHVVLCVSKLALMNLKIFIMQFAMTVSDKSPCLDSSQNNLQCEIDLKK